MKKTSWLLILSFLAAPLSSYAAPKIVLNARIDEAIEEFYQYSVAGKKLADKAAGMLVFPTVGKAGFGIGGEYGEGALIVEGKTVQYYSTAAASVGFQIGVQSRRQIILFMEKADLESFRTSKGWEIGADGSVAIATLGAGGEIDTKTLNQPIVAFVFGNKGLMANLSLEGSKISKIEKLK